MAERTSRIGSNDAILILSLFYCSLDLCWEWETFNLCTRPIHWWLIVSYACVIGFRLTHFLSGYLAEASGRADAAAASDFLLNLRHKGSVPRALVLLTWFITLPIFLVTTLVGTVWLYTVVQESPHCVPSTSHLWFSGCWLALCYVSFFIYASLAFTAIVIERRVQLAERDLREMEDDDVRARWGDVSSRATADPFGILPSRQRGLSPSEIRSIGGEFTAEAADVESASVGDSDCPICIQPILPGEHARRLPQCGHSFHRSCVDLWLLRGPDCPLCKQDVRERASTPRWRSDG